MTAELARGRVLVLGSEDRKVGLPAADGLEAEAPLDRRLRELGYEVVRGALERGIEAEFRRGRPDAAVVEGNFEELPAVLVRLRKDPGFRHVPVVALLAAEEEPPGDALDVPMVEYLPVTVPLERLVGRVRSNVDAKRLIDFGERKSERLASLLEISRALTSTLDSGAILYIIARKLSEEMELVRCSFIVPDLAHGIGRVIACKDDPNIHALEINLGNYPEIIQVLRTGRRVVISDVGQDPIMAGIRKFADVFRDQSIMTLPLPFHDETIGVLQIRKKSQTRGFTSREIEYCELLANAAANALKNAQLYEDIEKHNYELRRQKRELEDLSGELKKKNHELIELQQMKEDFTAMIVHDLRSPMMIVQGVLDLLRLKHRGNPADAELIDDGIGVTKKILALINNLLEVSKIEAGELQLMEEDVEVATLILETAEPYKLLAHGRGIALETVVRAGLPVIKADRRSLGQVLDNLLANAFKFSPDGGRVRVSAEASPDAPADEVVITVEDNGMGISAEDLPNIFKRFRQGRTNYRKGTGLGLTIVELMVTAHGGSVAVESEPGKGTQFVVRLPVRSKRKKISSGAIARP